MPRPTFHEDLTRDEPVKVTPDRPFGFLFAFVFLIIAMFPLIGGGSVRSWALTVAAVFAVVAIIVPWLLRPLKVAWLRLGMLLHHVVTPITMGAIFFIVMTPTGFIMKLIRRDAMHRKFDPSARTYWIDRDEPGTDPARMRNQY